MMSPVVDTMEEEQDGNGGGMMSNSVPKTMDSVVVEEDGSGQVIVAASTTRSKVTNGIGVASSSKRLHSSQSSGMESSVLRFKNVNFVVGSKDKKKHILSDVSGTVKFGHVLAVMGPSGAGKTTLISALTLDAHYGQPYGTVTLNGVPITDQIFKSHCYVVKQHDKHWPYITCRETLRYAAELYEVAAPEDMDAIVEEIIIKMGLSTCADKRNAQLSGGQQRRLSIGIALLKQPTLLFLDEPTSGLDAAAASNIMQEIVRVAKEERLIIMCTIHQPSTKVYNGFDQIMIMSRGREAFAGGKEDAIPYFESIGFPCPPATNPAEFYLDLVNSDFSDEKAVTHILDTWEEMKPEAGSSSHHKKGFGDTDDDGQQGVVDMKRAPLRKEIAIMFRRHLTIVIRDPLLYIGRSMMFLMSSLFFAFVYWNARDFTQDQAINKVWVNVWFVGVPSNMGVAAVYALNDEFKSILRENRNGMVSGVSYVLAKTVLVIPILFFAAICCLGIPAFVIQNIPGEAFGPCILLCTAVFFVFESVAECLAVWFEDPIIGMLQFMNVWFASFLFGGFMIPRRDMYWPFALFYYILPFSYYVRSSTYEMISPMTFAPCDPATAITAVCTTATSGTAVLGELHRVLPLIEPDVDTYFDLGMIILIGVFFKVLYIVGVIYKTTKVVKIESAPPSTA